MDAITFIKKYKIVGMDLQNLDKIVIEKLNDIFNGKIRESYNDPLLCRSAGLYCECELKKYDLAEQYYLMAIAIKTDDTMAIQDLANVYNVQKNMI